MNARVAADLLNDAAVRAGLRERGFAIPEATRFLAGLHDTTTDEVPLYDLADLPGTHAPTLATLQAWLTAAGRHARAERAPRLGAPDGDALLARARDWAEPRPEWGLAGNAALVIAPRERTRGLDLRGRAFLHDYRPERDPDGSVLELLLTAPMVAAH